jgi:4-amino-4-deoxy-L-arabinose transferase-like glycosyltransferase
MNHRPFWLFTLLVVAIPILPSLVTQGMYQDGMFYAAISRNYAAGGTFWSPTAADVSWGTPPLMFWMEGLFFKAFGDGFWVEKLFSGCMFAVHIAVIVWVWDLLWGNLYGETRKMAWWPILIWAVFPKIVWSFSNNLPENPTSLFALISFGFMLKAFKSKYLFLYSLLSGLAILCALLSKGFVGVFTLAVPLCYYLVLDNHMLKKAIIITSFSLVFLILTCWILSFYPPTAHFFEEYLKTQLLPNANHSEDVNNLILSRATFAITLLKEILLPLLFMLSIVFVAYLKAGKRFMPWFEIYHLRIAVFLFLVGFCASLPLMVSNQLRAFYLVPSEIYFALGFAVISISPLLFLVRFFTTINRILLSVVSLIGWLLLMSTCISIAGKTNPF